MDSLHNIIYANGSVSVTLNSILIYCILKFTRPEFGSYKYLMLCFAISNLLYAVMHMVIVPVLHVYGHAYIFFPGGILRNNVFLGHWTIVFWGFLFGLSLALVSLHFVYRYMAICRAALLKTMHSPQYLVLMVLFCVVHGIIWGGTFHFGSTHLNIHKDHIRQTMLDAYGVNVNDAPIVGLLLVVNETTNSTSQEIFYWPCCLAGGLCILSWISTIITIFASSWRIHKSLSNSGLSEKVRKLQYALFKALVIQTIVPLVLDYTPSLFCHICILFDLRFGSFVNYVVVGISFYPVLDPLTMIYFIQDYRDGLLSKMKFFRTESKVYATPSGTTTGKVEKIPSTKSKTLE